MRTIQQNRFSSKVFGPLGSYITVKDQYKNYSNAVEKVLYKILHTFVVDNLEDRNHLVNLIKSANLFSKFHVIYQPFRGRYQTATQSDPSLISIADILNVDEDIIFNVLVDQARIDEVIVVADERESDSK
jgi:chromosome segregation ATPase